MVVGDEVEVGGYSGGGVGGGGYDGCGCGDGWGGGGGVDGREWLGECGGGSELYRICYCFVGVVFLFLVFGYGFCE